MKIETKYAALLVGLLSVIGLSLGTASAAAAVSPLYDLSPCVNSATVTCLAPQLTTLSRAQPYCQPFANGQEYQQFQDGNGVLQDWTYSNGSHACINVLYQTGAMELPPPVCHYYFYVPYNGYADARIYFGWAYYDNGISQISAPLNEAPAAGWTEIQMNGGVSGDPYGASGVAAIQFQDNNGDTPGSTFIGWGTSATWGIKRVC